MVIAAAGISAAATVGSAALSASSKPKGGGAAQTQESDRTPWQPQGDAIKYGLDQQQGIYDERTKQGAFQGSLYAGLTGGQDKAMETAQGYAAVPGASAVGRADNVGQQGQTGMQNYMTNAQTMAGGGLGGPANADLTGALNGIGRGAQPIVDPALSGALRSAATQGAQSIGSFNAGLGKVMDAGMADPTQQLVGSARSFMDNGATQAMINNVNGQIDATLNEETLPGLNRQASMGGNLNSSRAGMAEAMALRSAALAKGNASAQIMNNAYNTGLQTAAGQRTAGLSAALGAGTAGLTGNGNLALGAGNQDISATQTQIGAATAGLGQQTSRDAADAQVKLSGNNQLAQGVQMGLGADRQGQLIAGGNVDLLNGAGALQQGENQGQLTEAYQQYQLKNQYQQGLLNDYMTNVNKPSGYYQSSTKGNTQTTNPSNLPQMLAGGGVALASQFAKGGLFDTASAPSVWDGAGVDMGSSWTGANPALGFA